MDAAGFHGWSQGAIHRPAPIFIAAAQPVMGSTFSLIDVDVTVNVPPRPDASEREYAFRRHWAFRPPPKHPPLSKSVSDMRPFVDRMLLSIEQRQWSERMQKEAERLHLKQENGRARKAKKKP